MCVTWALLGHQKEGVPARVLNIMLLPPWQKMKRDEDIGRTIKNPPRT